MINDIALHVYTNFYYCIVFDRTILKLLLYFYNRTTLPVINHSESNISFFFCKIFVFPAAYCWVNDNTAYCFKKYHEKSEPQTKASSCVIAIYAFMSIFGLFQ